MSYVVWLTGLSGSGKSTIANILHKKLSKHTTKVTILDGDIVRDFFDGDLGYTRQERIANIKRIAFVSYILSKYNILVIVANIAPYYEARDFIRRKIKNYIQIYLKADIETCLRRSPKKYYEKFIKGELNNFVGLDEPYDIPRNPHLVVNTVRYNAEECAEYIYNYLIKKLSFLI